MTGRLSHALSFLWDWETETNSERDLQPLRSTNRCTVTLATNVTCALVLDSCTCALIRPNAVKGRLTMAAIVHVLVFFSFVVLQVSLSFTDHCPAEETCNGSSSLPAAASLATPTEKLIRAISKKVQRNVVDSSEGLYVSIKTTLKYHSIRLPHILFTWLQNVFPSQVLYYVTTGRGSPFCTISH